MPLFKLTHSHFLLLYFFEALLRAIMEEAGFHQENHDKPSVTFFILLMMPTIKLLCVIEATTVTGPAKALINFSQTARSSAHLAAGLPRVEHVIVTFARGAAGQMEDNQFVAAARAAGIQVEVISERFRFDTRIIDKLRRVVARCAPDIIESHMVKSHFLVKLSGLGRQIPWVAFHHGYTTTDMKMRFYNQLNRWSLPSAARVVTVCRAFARQLARAGVDERNIFVRHNAISPPMPADEEGVRALRHRLGVETGQHVILAVGRMSREKGHVDLIRAVGELRRLRPALNLKLVIVGDGPERGRVKRLAVELDISDRVVFVGHTDDVVPYYALAHVLALPSHSEGSPLVLLEAMAAGVPVVATNVGGVPEIVTDRESALLTAPNDPTAFAAALGLVLTNQQLSTTLAMNALNRTRADFSPETYARALVGLYPTLLADSSRSTSPTPVAVS